MSDGWEALAREDPLWAIDPTLSGYDVEAFRATGAALVEQVLAWAAPLPAHDRALEIGFGVGRNLVHLAERFTRVDGVDASPTMVALAREHGVPDNAHLRATNGRDLAPFEDAAFDLVFSNLVLQHIEDEAVVATYLRETARVLKPAGAAVLQFDTRRLSLGAQALRRLPDPLLPADRRSAMRRHPRTPEWIRTTAPLDVDAEHGSPENRWFVLRKPAA